MYFVVWCLMIIITRCSASNQGGGEKNSIMDINENVTEHLEPINGTHIYRLIKPEKGPQWLTERDIKMDSCVRRAECEPLTHNRSICLGAKLPYNLTSVQLTFHTNQYKIQAELETYRLLINVPKCWAVIQPLLCATFMPKCEKVLGHDMVYLPSYEMCKITMEPCSILYNTSYFPPFLRCNETRFPPKCENDAREMKFNTTGQCMSPLIRTNKAAHFYEGIFFVGLIFFY